MAHPDDGANCRPDLLGDIRIVDLTMGWAGPLATRQLADMGAEVIKVESCQYFDWWRGWESTPESIAQKLYEQSTAFNTTGRNKFGITLDLTSRRGKDLLLVIENYTASVLPKLGLAYERLREANPELVLVSMPPFGASGNWMDHRAYGSTVEQASGLPHINGRAGDPPTMQHVALGDPIAGINAAAALVTALRHLRRTGEGQYVDLSHVESMFPLAAHGLVEQAIRGTPPERCGGRHPLHAPWGAYPCIGAEPWIVITVETEEQWRRLSEVLGIDGDASRFAAGPDRKKHEDALDEAIASRTELQDGLALERRLAAAGVPAAVLRNTMDVLYDPHLEARGYWQWRERAFVGNQPNPSAPYRPLGEGHDNRPYAVEWPAPTLGQHNREVLSRLLGLSEAELDALEADDITPSHHSLRRLRHWVRRRPRRHPALGTPTCHPCAR
ncbi:MAG: CoA transferase [Acidobacteria bacterium]|nr:CoA transferase [Acidobacteriota bacterium]